MFTSRWGRPASLFRTVLSFVGAALVATGFSAGAAELRVFVDQDVNTATGCTVSTPSGDFKGAEQVFVTTVDTTASPPRVTGVTSQACTNAATNTFGAPVAVSAGGWNVGVGNGTNGYNVIESGFALPAGVSRVRLGFVYFDGISSSDALIAAATGDPIIVSAAVAPIDATPVPTLSGPALVLLLVMVAVVAFVFRRGAGRNAGTVAIVLLAFVATLASAAIVLDGLTGDWTGTTPLPDAVGDAPEGADIAAAFARIEGTTLFVRVDVKTGSAPTAAADSLSATPGVTLDVPAATGLLANDTRGTPAASVASYGGGSLAGAATDHAAGSSTALTGGGALTVQADGGVSFTPPAGFATSFTFDYRLANAYGSSVATVTIAARAPPAFTSAGAATFTVGNAGSFTVTASGSPKPTLALTAGALPSGVTFNAATGVLSGTPGAGTAGTYPLTFTASNGVNPDATQSFTLTLNQGTSITSANAATFTVGAAGTFTITTSATPAAATISMTGALPSGVTFTNNGNGTATLAGTPAAGTGGTYPLTITASNGVGSPGTQSFTLTVNQPPAITSANNATFTVGNAGSFTVTATGFPAPTQSITGGLPGGVTFNAATGVLSGTPAAGTAGTYPLTFTASNGTTPNATQSFTLTVNQGTSITSANAATFTVGAAGTFTITTSATPAATTISVTGALPSGVTFTNNGNGTATLAGTPAAGTGGTYPLTITASNGVGSPGTQSFTLTVNQPPAITSANNATFTVGNAGSFTVTATGFPAPTQSITGGLPGGVTFNAATGVLSGTPAAGTAGTYPLVFTASNGTTPNATQNFTLTVNQSASITSANATTFATGVAGSFTITTSGSPTASTITQAGALPTGVTFVNNGNGTATLAGTPGAGTGGSYPLTITASNGVGSPGTQSFTLTVNQPPAITSANNATFTLGSAGSFTVTTTGFPSATVSVTGALPSGVTFTDNGNSTATLAGTPGAGTGGTYPLTFTAANGTSPNATQSFTLTVNQAPAITSANIATFIAGAAGTFTITTTGSPTAATITLGGTLPTGLTFTNNANGTATIAGTPGLATGGAYPVTITASNGVAPNASQALTVTVTQAPAITSANTASFSEGLAGTFTVTTTGFPVPGITRTGTLPTGVTFVDNGNGSGTLSGTPAAGTGASSPYAQVFTAANIAGNATQNFSLLVCPVISATPATLPQPTRTNAYTTTLSGSGGTGPYSFTLASGTLPTGLSLSGTGVLSGTPTAGGTFTFSVGVTSSAGCTGTTAYSVTVNEPPVAGTDTFDAVGNTLLEVAGVATVAGPKIFFNGNVLANDSDGNGGANGVGVAVASVGTFATSGGGSIALAANGTFAYVPAAGFSGADTFTYTVSDGIGVASGTISINVLAQRVWYVKNNGAAGTGTSTSPFNTLAAAVTASAAGDTLYVFAGDGTTVNQNAGAVLKNNQRLIGEGAALDVIATVNGVANPTLQPAGATPLIGNSAGNGVTLASANLVRGLNVGNSSGTALFGTSVGALAVDTVAISTTGQGLDLTGVSVPSVNVSLTGLTSTGGSKNVNLVGLGGTVSLGTGALSGASGNAFDVSGGTASIGYAGAISNASTGARAVSVAGKTAGTVSLSGAVTSSGTNPAGVVLTSNTGATINFSGGLALSTGTNPAFTATGGGTVSATQNNTTIVNTLSATTAAALNVANTTIGAAGLTFRSISSSGGTGNGIVLDTTGTSGGLAVTGDGTTTTVGGNSSGGTIANKAGADANNAQGAGIYLNSTRNVVLRRMTINGTNGNYGIHGYNVDGFTLEYSTVSGTMGSAASLPSPENYGEGAIHFGNVTTNGIATSGTFTNNVIAGGRARNLSIVNSAGSTTLAIKGNQFGLVQNFTDANQNLAVEARGTAGFTATLGDGTAGAANSFAGSPGDQVNFTGQTATAMNVTMIGNTLDNTHAQNIIGGGGLTLATQGTMNFTVQNNSIAGADGSAITLQLASAGTLLSGKIDGNTIGKSGVTGSGSKSGNGIFGSYAGTGTASVTITNNTVQQYQGNGGLFFDNTGGSYTANFTIKNNLVTQPGPSAFAGLALTNGAPLSTDTVNVCADVKNNDFSAGDPTNSNDVVVGASGAAAGHVFNLPGYVGTTLAQVQTFIQNNNSLPGSTTVSAFTDAPVTPAAFTGTGTSCPTPP